LGQLGWDGAKIKLVLCGEEKRFVLPLLIILVMTALANAVCHEFYVEPTLLATQASLHLLCGKRFVELSFNRHVFGQQWRLLVVACESGAGFVELARRVLFGTVLCAWAADGIPC
jgi:hypothetical protein